MGEQRARKGPMYWCKPCKSLSLNWHLNNCQHMWFQACNKRLIIYNKYLDLLVNIGIPTVQCIRGVCLFRKFLIDIPDCIYSTLNNYTCHTCFETGLLKTSQLKRV